ncbi:hypothetical protein N7468_000492 [Penicillium chermesinum]|uniref:Mitochondrial carrier n=1 Tax=Penicillium chermesinum TaxID=63820 RepID=A0A9W9PKE5_9EURO|nr:uncharacterized protein N7468_000492 [Penicillium chermesinum]KAJ5249041.1 hypothetical protein N7468_000492 [Penicillium chermesinum]
MYNTNTDIWAAGAFAAVVVDFIVYPVDTLKTRIQSANYEKQFKDAQTGALKRNVLFKGLYQGVWSVVFSTIPSSGAFFTTYEAVKSALHKTSTGANSSHPTAQSKRLPLHSLPTPIMHAIASSSAEAVSCLILTPAEVIKQNAQMIPSDNTPKLNMPRKTPIVQVLSQFKSQPWRLWSGYSALLGRNLPTTGIQFPLFEYVRARMVEWRRRRREERGIRWTGQREVLVERAGLTGLSAGMAGAVAASVTTPIDVVKTRMMLSASGSTGGKGGEMRRGGTGKGRLRLEGIFSVRKGLGVFDICGWLSTGATAFRSGSSFFFFSQTTAFPSFSCLSFGSGFGLTGCLFFFQATLFAGSATDASSLFFLIFELLLLIFDLLFTGPLFLFAPGAALFCFASSGSSSDLSILGLGFTRPGTSSVSCESFTVSVGFDGAPTAFTIITSDFAVFALCLSHSS